MKIDLYATKWIVKRQVLEGREHRGLKAEELKENKGKGTEDTQKKTNKGMNTTVNDVRKHEHSHQNAETKAK